ncbi:Zn(II)2Cys6 transcription factor domain-containing protein [Aspergillus lucknowensis]|uniref:Zn(2)-C6 fungal-type domain-containing protein n=1 Tax=Aspergillus lucknowensis TaxID=176173 RepID=A0ABR4LMY6_9EURO
MTQRATNTRSRAGCLTCRQRHIRCDEQRPTCQKCLNSNKLCAYPPAVIPLRDRRVLQKNALPPGQQAPWALVETKGPTMKRLPASAVIDPFDSLPIKMPFRSQELYHYFYQTGAAFSVAPSNANDDCVAFATLDEHALRSTILIAGVHYSWNTGALQTYESSFLFHKIESIRTINKWLAASDRTSFVVCVRQILTICLAEACLGNLPAAETHLSGVMALFDSHSRMDCPADSTNDIGSELADRYLLLTSCFVFILKSRLEDFKVFLATQGIDPRDNSSAEALKLIKSWHSLEHGGLDARLKAMRLFPYFFAPPPMHRAPQMIDAIPILECLQVITGAVDRARINPTPEQRQHVWNDGGLTRLLLDLVHAHVASFARDDKDKTATSSFSPMGTKCPPSKSRSLLYSSWSGLSAAAELYMYSILGIVDSGNPLECRLLYRVALVLKRDVQQSRGHLTEFANCNGESMLRSLWFWKVFNGVLTLYKHFSVDIKAVRCGCEGELQDLYRWFRGCARAWSGLSRKMHWDDVQCELAKISWPSVLPAGEEDYAADLWAGITFGGLE